MSKILLRRRHFLQSAATAAVSGSLLGTMGILQRAQAAAAGTDYKALVCVYLDGGADSFSLIAPNLFSSDPSQDHAVYAESRSGVYDPLGNPGGMAIAQSELLPLTGGGAGYGLHPGMEGMQSLFNSGKLATIANVGSLIEPVTKLGIENQTARLPPQLFSHSDQTAQWEKAYANSVEPKGWFGKVADRVQSLNSSPSPSMNISLTGNNLLQVGSNVLPYSVDRYRVDPAAPADPGDGGPIGLFTGYADAAAARATVETIMATSAHTFGAEYSAIKNRAIENYDLISGALESVPNLTAFSPYPDDEFQQQLHMVARMIAIRSSLGACRQTFVVRLGGWDTHDSQNADVPELAQRLSDGLAAFYQATVDLGVESSVATFSFTEFSRTLNSNGMGTDHGWGGHQFVMGGAVSGGQIVGTMPNLTLEGPSDLGRGRLFPTQSVEQYAATLATWFGVDASDLNLVFPNIGNFGSNNLGFMA